jgi:hypothetical protein
MSVAGIAPEEPRLVARSLDHRVEIAGADEGVMREVSRGLLMQLPRERAIHAIRLGVDEQNVRPPGTRSVQRGEMSEQQEANEGDGMFHGRGLDGCSRLFASLQGLNILFLPSPKSGVRCSMFDVESLTDSSWRGSGKRAARREG